MRSCRHRLFEIHWDAPTDGTSPLSLESSGVVTGIHQDLRKEREMPVRRGKDGDGPYYRWGESGKKYHYESGNKSSREKAKASAEKQGRAARASGYRG